MPDNASTAAELREPFSAYARAVRTLLDAMPAIYIALERKGSIDELPGWRSMQMRFQAFQDQGGQPIQVAMLFGPSGAGKSTVFRQLTGIDVPAGGEIRPMTFGCAVAAPPALATADRLEKLFPFYELAVLSSPEQLAQKDQPTDLLYFAKSDRVPQSSELPLVLVDVPDFTTFCTENWAKAERMLERAEIVIFVVFDEAYSDNRVIENLALACRKASFLAYLFTKTSRGAAEKKWAHLLQVVESSQAASQFAEKRVDGRSVKEFLAAAPVYHSTRSETPQLADITPVTQNTPPFDSLMVGQDAERIILSGLLESTSQSVRSSEELLGEARRLATDLQSLLDSTRQQVSQAAATIARGEFPVLRLLAIAVEEAQAAEVGWLRTIKSPMRWLLRGASSIYASAKTMVQAFQEKPSGDTSVRPLAELEREGIAKQSEQLATHWRLQFPLEATSEGMLSATACDTVHKQLLATDPPEPATHWEGVIRQAVRTWCQEHRAKALALSACGDMFVVAAGGIVVLDLVHTGGLGIGSASLLAGAPATAFAVAKLIELLNLRGVAERALAEWQTQRQAELSAHLQKHFADPLFKRWIDRLAALDLGKIDACSIACRDIDHLLKRLRQKA